MQRGATQREIELITATWKCNRKHSLFLYIVKQPEVVYFFFFYFESVILAATMMDDCIRRLAQLFYCLCTHRNMPSLGGYHSIKPRHSSLPETLTGFPHGPPISSLSLAIIILMLNLLSADLHTKTRCIHCGRRMLSSTVFPPGFLIASLVMS